MGTFNRLRTYDERSIEGELHHLNRIVGLIERDLLNVDIIINWLRKGYSQLLESGGPDVVIEDIDKFQKLLNKLDGMVNTGLLEFRYEIQNTEKRTSGSSLENDKYYTSTEITHRLKVDRSTVKKWFDKGEFPNHRQKSKKIKEIPYHDMKVFFNKHPKYKDIFFSGEKE
ncbi:MAG: hypothetical protein WCK92_01615 [Bacteroidota bacterium]